ncbi:MAG: disulfide bond formation protein B [Hyphomonadaceae bacterium JAD_PAG50586_4]|nr:MAG: disulfide bond formation protein B [Hyphomonadaceae bacterium JAD_PAG50586_4]
MSTDIPSENAKNSGQPRTWWLLLAAWLVALSATLGALFIGEVMGQTPCLLCWYQRIFMFPLALILLIACVKEDAEIWRYALPLALLGFGFALYHSLLYGGIIAEPIVQCGAGPSCSSASMSLFGWLPIPFLSLIAFSATSILLFLARRRSS